VARTWNSRGSFSCTFYFIFQTGILLYKNNNCNGLVKIVGVCCRKVNVWDSEELFELISACSRGHEEGCNPSHDLTTASSLYYSGRSLCFLSRPTGYWKMSSYCFSQLPIKYEINVGFWATFRVALFFCVIETAHILIHLCLRPAQHYISFLILLVKIKKKNRLLHTADLYMFNHSDYVTSGVMSCTYKLWVVERWSGQYVNEIIFIFGDEPAYLSHCYGQ